MRPILGGGLVALSLFLLLGFFSADLAGSAAATWAALLVAVGVPGVAGSALLYQHFAGRNALAGRRDALRRQTQEAEVLRLAGEHDGRLTAVEVVRDLAMSHDDADALLRRLVERGAADVEVTDTGLIVYRFDDIRRLGDKSTGRGVLDA